MAATTQVDTSLDILQPEVMTKEELICTLQQKKVSECDLKSLEKETLLEMYYKSVLPMPQRKYRLNRRGQSATKQQVTMAKKKRKFTDISMELSKDSAGSQQSGLITSFRLPQSTPPADRLKPPPVNIERKIIRLKSKSSDLSGIVINDRTKVGVNSATKGDSKTTSASPSVSPTGQQTTPDTGKAKVQPRAIKLKRASLSTSESPVTSNKMDTSPEVKNGKESKTSPLPKSPEESDEEVATKKFKKVSITWP